MVLTQKRKVLVVLLGLGTIALVVDRMLPGGGQTGPRSVTAAMTADISTDTGRQGTPELADLGNTATLVDDSLAMRLDGIRVEQNLDPQEAKDAFCPSDSWLSLLRPEEPVVVAASSDEVRAKDFQQAHELKAVVLFENGGAAIIDEEYLAVGKELDGFRLIRVDKGSAVLGLNGVEVTLSLDVEQEDN